MCVYRPNQNADFGPALHSAFLSQCFYTLSASKPELSNLDKTVFNATRLTLEFESKPIKVPQKQIEVKAHSDARYIKV